MVEEELEVREGLARKEHELLQVVDDDSARPTPSRTAGGELFSFNCGDLADWPNAVAECLGRKVVNAYHIPVVSPRPSPSPISARVFHGLTASPEVV